MLQPVTENITYKSHIKYKRNINNNALNGKLFKQTECTSVPAWNITKRQVRLYSASSLHMISPPPLSVSWITFHEEVMAHVTKWVHVKLHFAVEKCDVLNSPYDWGRTDTMQGGNGISLKYN